MICPDCGAAVPAAPVAANITICPYCVRSLVVEGDSVRFAVDTDSVHLTSHELSTLRHARHAARKANRWSGGFSKP